MILQDFYLPPNLAEWQGRADAAPQSYFFQIIKPLDLHKITTASAEQPAFAFLGFCCDEGIRRNLGRVGAAKGPQAIREILARMPIHRNVDCFDAGNITCINGDLETAQQQLGDAVALLLQQKITPIVLGGGHELAYGHYQGLAKTFSEKSPAIINMDAHFDMRPLLIDDKGSSGTPFLQIAKAQEKNHQPFSYHCIGIQPGGNTKNLFATAKQYQTNFLLADDINQHNQEYILSFVKEIIDKHKHLYLSLCLDVFAAAFAPGVSAPQALGLTPWQLLPLVRTLAVSGKMVSYDIAELSPPYDIDHRTAKLAAHFIYDIIHHHAGKESCNK